MNINLLLRRVVDLLIWFVRSVYSRKKGTAKLNQIRLNPLEKEKQKKAKYEDNWGNSNH
jgi:hypothetical protein